MMNEEDQKEEKEETDKLNEDNKKSSCECNKIHLYIPFIINVILVPMELWATVKCFYDKGFKRAIIFYTFLSNQFALVTALIHSIFLFLKIKNNRNIPFLLIIFKLLSTCCVTLTFLIVVFVLTILEKNETLGRLLFHNTRIVQHFFGPILAFVSFTFWEVNFNMSLKYIPLPFIPTLIYGCVMIPLNALDLVKGPYPFLEVNRQGVLATIIWIIVLGVVNMLISTGIILFTNFLRNHFPKIQKVEKEENLIAESDDIEPIDKIIE